MIEYWDVYDKDRNKTGKIVKRGDKLNDNEYHLVVNVWIKNSKNEFLITQRSENKKHPLMWECTGGSALEGEDSLTSAVRETKEELGIDLNKEESKFIGRTFRYYSDCPDILEVWLFKSDILLNEITIQKEEVNDVMWASKERIKELYKNNKFEANAFFEEALNQVQ